MDINRIRSLEHSFAPWIVREGYWPGMILIAGVSALGVIYAALASSGIAFLGALLLWMILSVLWRIGCESVLAIFALLSNEQFPISLQGGGAAKNPQPAGVVSLDKPAAMARGIAARSSANDTAGSAPVVFDSPGSPARADKSAVNKVTSERGKVAKAGGSVKSTPEATRKVDVPASGKSPGRKKEPGNAGSRPSSRGKAQ